MRREGVAELAEWIRSHPQFPAAARQYVVEYAEWRDKLGLINKVVSNAARLRVLENLIYLHYVAPLADGGRGATFERLTELSGLTGDVGARAVRTLLRLAQAGGLVVTGRDATDGRLRVFEPTEALLAEGRNYASLTLKPLDVLYPHLAVCERLADDPQFYRWLVTKMGGVSPDAGRPQTATSDPFRDVMRLEGAMPIYAVVLDRHFRDANLPTAAEFSRRFFVSQSQARAVLKAAESLGLIKTGPRGRLLDAEPLVKVLFHRYAHLLALTVKNAFSDEALASLIN